MKEEIIAKKSVLPDKYSSGPHGVGDPEDRTLRKVEREVLIPKLMREKARAEKCVKEVTDFNQCCLDSSIFLVVKCREQNDVMKSCLTSWYQNEDFRNLCTEEYLKQRSEYRRTGVKKSMKRA